MRTVMATLRRFAVVGFAVVCLVLGGSGLWVAHAEAAPTYDPVLSTLRVVGPNGSPLSNVALRVQVVPQWPALETWGARSYPTIGEGSTDNNGYLHVAVTYPRASDRALYGNHDTVNLQLLLIAPNGKALPLTSFPRYLGSDPQRAATFSQPLHASGHAIHVSATTLTKFQQLSRARVPYSGCGGIGYWQQVTYGYAWTVIGDLHSETWTGSDYFAYGSTADSNIGVQYTYDGGSTWSLSGDINIGNTASARATVNKGGQNFGQHVKGYFQYGKYQWYDDCGLPTDTYEIAANFWTGGITTGDDITWCDNNPNGYTIRLQSGYEFKTVNETAYHYGGAASVFGLGFDAQSGFSGTSVEFYITAANGQYGFIYGRNNWPAQADAVYVSNWCPSVQTSCWGS